MALDNNLGWLPDLEKMHDEAMLAMTLADGALPCSTPPAFAIPATLDPDWFIQAVQGVWPFCHAFMRCGIFRVLYWLTTKGQQIDVSEYYAAITDMMMDGDASQASGASIAGSLRASIKYGEAGEKTLPYPNSNVPSNMSIDAFYRKNYSSKLPTVAVEDAKQRHIKSIVPNIRTYKDLDNALVSGRTAVGFGMDWYTGWDQLKDIDTLNYVPSGRFRGGHALMFFGWRTINGVRYPLMHNSHEGWGKRRRIAIHPNVVQTILQNSKYGALAVTNIDVAEKEVKAQPWDWLNDIANFKAKPIDPFNPSDRKEFNDEEQQA